MSNQHNSWFDQPTNPTAVQQQQQQQPESALAALRASVMAFMDHMHSRMWSLECSISRVQGVLDEQNRMALRLHQVVAPQYLELPMSSSTTTTCPLTTTTTTTTTPTQFQTPMQLALQQPTTTTALPTPPTPQNLVTNNEAPQFSGVKLQITGVTTRWFTDRSYPPFVVDAVDERTGVRCTDANFQVELHAVDGNGKNVDDAMGDAASRSITLANGTAEVTSLKFTVVSSKNGGHFVLYAEPSFPCGGNRGVKKGSSENISILSCRLFHNPKRQLEELTADDQLSKMPGIGRLYAERFSASGIQTIRQLSAIGADPDNDIEQQQRATLLAQLRRDKGTMTDQKLLQYIVQAQSIVNTTNEQLNISAGTAISTATSSSTPSSSPKRRKLSDAITTSQIRDGGSLEFDVDHFIHCNPPSPLTLLASPQPLAATSSSSPLMLLSSPVLSASFAHSPPEV